MKRGQGGIIAIVLILVIVILAIVVLWEVVKKNAEKSEEIDINIITADLKIEKSKVFINETSGKLQLSVKRESDNAELSFIKFVVLGDNQEIYTSNDYPFSFESKTYVLNISNLKNIKEILVYPVSEKGVIGIGEKYEVHGNELKEIEDLVVISPDVEMNCVPNLQCDDWGECQAIYDVGDIIDNEGILLQGTQTKLCEDINKCVYDVIERQDCDTQREVIIETIEKCEKKYVEIYGTDMSLISRLELVDGKLNIQFPLDKQEYFPYCYNTEQDCDETGVNCGGSCSPCG